jgi:hypothetical protein
MHTFNSRYKNDDDQMVSVTIIHHGDYSGDAIVNVRPVDNAGGFEIKVPCEAFFDFIGGALGDRMIGHLEQLSGREVLDKLAGPPR